jgi:small subunit ribosomal protein S1
LRAADISPEKVDDVRTKFQVGDVVEAKIAGVDRKVHAVLLTMKAKEAKAVSQKKAPAKAAAAAAKATGSATTSKKKSESSLKTTFGDLFKDHINGSDDKDKDDNK